MMNTKNSLKLLPIIILLILASSCSNQAAVDNPASIPESTIAQVQLINPLGPAVIPVAGLASGNVSGEIAIDVRYWKTADEAIGLLAADEAEFAVLPITTGVNMTASGMELTLLGVHEWKVFYMIASEGNEFKDWSSLIGKTIYTPGSKGQTVDILTRYALMKEDITPDKDVTFVYAPGAEIVALFQEGKIDYAALPEPFVTQALASSNGKIVLDYQDYWTEVSGAQDGIPIAGLFVKSIFLSDHPETTAKVVELFIESAHWANENAELAVQAAAEVLPLSSDVILSALQRIKFEYIPAKDSQEQVIQFLETMQNTYPEGIKLIPEDDFFAAE